MKISKKIAAVLAAALVITCVFVFNVGSIDASASSGEAVDEVATNALSDKRPTITENPSSQTAVVGSTITFSVKVIGQDLSYQWYYRTNAYGSWKESGLKGCKTATVVVTAKEFRNGYQYFCKVSNDSGYAVSSTATITVIKKPAIASQPESNTFKLGSTATFSITATGATNYQWQYRTSPAGTWYKSGARGANTAAVSVGATRARDGFQYRCKLTNEAGSVYSETVTLHVVESPSIQTQPVDRSVREGITTTFSVSAAGDSLNYQWQYRKTSGSKWYASGQAGAETNTLRMPATAARNGFQFRCKVWNAVGTVYSDIVSLKVTQKPVIKSRPEDVAAIDGTTVSFSVSADYASEYQWQYRRSSTGSWLTSTMKGAKTDTVYVPATASRNGYQYRCKISNEAGYVYTNAVTLSVKEDDPGDIYWDATYIGRLKIPDVGLAVNLYETNGGAGQQTIVDRLNSACWMDWNTSPIIADHVDQGFSAIKTLPIGTKLTIDRHGVITTYKLVELDLNGTSNGASIQMSDGRRIHSLGEGYIALYTCNENWTSVTIAVFLDINY